jgi:hypothetical protein
MEEMCLNLFQSLEEHVSNEKVRLAIYRDIIPSIINYDDHIAEELYANDPMFDQAYNEYLGEEDAQF